MKETNTERIKISERLLEEIQNCKTCKTILGYRKFPTTSHGQLDAKYILVSEAPGKDSLDKGNGKYWIGAGGQILRDCTAKAKTTLEELFYLTDIIKCWPNEDNKNRTPKPTEISNCSHFLTTEIEKLKPKLILAFGKTASTYLLNREVRLKLEHGNVYNYNSTTLILVLLHPANIDRQKTARNKPLTREIYKQQLTLVFEKLKDGKLNEIKGIFN